MYRLIFICVALPFILLSCSANEVEVSFTQKQIYWFGHKSESLHLIFCKGKFGFIDDSGKITIPCAYDNVGYFSDGLAVVQVGDRCGFIDIAGQIIIPLSFEAAMPFSEGHALVYNNNKYGYIDKNGSYVIKPDLNLDYDYSHTSRIHLVNDFSFHEGLAIAEDGKGFKYIDTLGKTKVDGPFESARSFEEGLALVQMNGKYGYINNEGDCVIKAQFDNGRSFSDGLAAICLNGKWGFIDKTGDVVIPILFDMAYGFSEGLACCVVAQSGVPKAGYIDMTGRFVIPPQFGIPSSFKLDYGIDAFAFSEGMAVVEIEGKYGYIDRNGSVIILPSYSIALPFNDGMAVVVDDLANNYRILYYIDMKGAVVYKSDQSKYRSSIDF